MLAVLPALPALPVDLPNVATAKLPATYEAAKVALADCVKIDECKDWADKAEALASYARQSGDTELRKMADRIQARALDRCGELLRQIPTAQGQRNDLKELEPERPGSLKLSPRAQAIEAAGMSKDEAKAALAINSVPRDEFESAVESDKPPTAKKLAEMGRKKRARPLLDLGGRSPKEFAAATALIGIVEDFVSEAKTIKLDIALRGCEGRERKQLLNGIRSAVQWLNEVERAARNVKCPTKGKTSRGKSTKR